MSYVPKKLKKVGSIQKAPLTKSVVVKTKPKMAWERAYDARFTGSKFGNEAIGLFALGLQFNIDDIDAVGAESVTGHGDDKKCDLCYFDDVTSAILMKRKRDALLRNATFQPKRDSLRRLTRPLILTRLSLGC